MPQISKIKYSDVLEAHRFDAEYFKLSDLKNISQLKQIKHSIINSNETFVTDGEHWSPQRDDKSNIKYISAEKIKEWYIDLWNFRTIAIEQFKRNKRASLQEKDILVYSVWVNAGLVAMAEPHLFPASIPRSVAIIRLNGKEWIHAEFLTIFWIQNMENLKHQGLEHEMLNQCLH